MKLLLNVSARGAWCLLLLLSGLRTQGCFGAERQAKAIIAYLFVKDRVIARDEVAARKLTRINYAFANIQNGEIVPGFMHDHENLEILHSLKQKNPGLEVLVSVGGWTWSGAFSDIALTPESRSKFIESAVLFIEQNNLDGLDIDWEYPGMTGNGNTYRAEDKQNYTALLRELRKRLDEEGRKLGRHLVTSVATGASSDFISHTEMNKVQRYVDSVNLMSYDYYEADFDSVTGHHAPLYTNPADPKHVSADASVQLYEQAGVPARKIVLGVPFYGHAWTEVGDRDHGLYQPGTKTDLEADYNVISGTLLQNGFVRYWDSLSSAPYLYNAATRTFVSYDDPASIALKCAYVTKHKLAGIMFWDYSGDASQTLLDAIDNGLGHSAGE